MKCSKIFEGNDGTRFSTAAECKQYEDSGRLLDLLSNRPRENIKAALDRTDAELSDAFERAGNLIAMKRRKGGELKRARKKTAC